MPYTDMAPKGGETPFFLVILLLIFFPPAAWYVMWKEEEYHVWFPWLIGFYGLLTILFSIFTMFYIIPTIQSLSKSLQIVQPRTVSTQFLNIFIILGFLEVLLAGIVFFHKKKFGKLPKTWLIISVIAVAFNSMIQPAIQGSLTYIVLSDIYKQTRLINPEVAAPSPSPSDSAGSQTSDWKTYTNEQLGFSIKYPSGMELDTRLIKPVNIEDPTCLATLKPHIKTNKMYISVCYYDNSKKLSLSELDNSLSRPTDVDGITTPQLDSTENKELFLTSGTKVIYQKDHNCVARCPRYIIEHGNKVYTLTYRDIYNKSEAEFNNIVATLKFLDQSNISPPVKN